MAKPQPKWSVVEKARNIHEFRLNGSLKTGSEAWILWMADEHFDHPKCNLDLLKQHHNEAVDRGALIVKAGDTFCAMQGKGDPRGDKGSVRDETSVYKHHETCLIERLCQSLRDKGGITRKGGYSGWVRLMLTGHGTKTYSYRAFYHHGAGGGGPVTKGLIDFNRMAEYVEADAFISGHVHWKNCTPVQLMQLSDASVLHSKTRHYVRCGTYKDEFEDGHAGFHVEKGRGPRPLGGWWQRFSVRNNLLVTDWIEAK
jgi:hypothetical protein